MRHEYKLGTDFQLAIGATPVGHETIVFVADNVYVPGIGGELVRKSSSADTFKLRELGDGSKHEVLKNSVILIVAS